jgi:hypothetical protein
VKVNNIRTETALINGVAMVKKLVDRFFPVLPPKLTAATCFTRLATD